MCQYRHHRDLVKEKGGNTTHLYKEEWYTATSHSKNVPLNSRKKISLTVLSIALVPGDHSTLDLISSSAWPSDLPSKIQELFLKAEVPSLVLEVFCFFVDVECIFYHQKNMEGGGGFRYCCWWFYCVFVDLFTEVTKKLALFIEVGRTKQVAQGDALALDCKYSNTM